MPLCTAQTDEGHTCLEPATHRVVLEGHAGHRCDDHPMPDCIIGIVKVTPLRNRLHLFTKVRSGA